MTNEFESIRSWAEHLFTGDSIALRPLREGDLDRLAAWWNEPGVAVFQGDRILLPSQSSVKAMFESWSKNDSSSGAGYAITNHDGDLVGHVALWGVTPPVMIANVAIIIGTEHQGNGYGRDALVVALRYAFQELGVRKVELQVWEFNTRARGLYSSLGFVEEGIRRDAAYHRSRYYDVVLMGMLRDEYEAYVVSKESSAEAS